jgi:hypothetical protein
MAERARITSVEAIEAFRANLILYLSKARPTVEEVSNDVLRAKQWLQNDQRRLWENEIRVRNKKLEQEKEELFNATLSRLHETTALQQMAVNRAQRAVREAEATLVVLKKWDRELENRSAPLLKQVDQLLGFLTAEMPRAVAHLSQVVKTLDAYTGVALPGGRLSDAPKTETQPAALPSEPDADGGEHP